MKIIFLSGTKKLGLAQYLIQFLVCRPVGMAQNIWTRKRTGHKYILYLGLSI